MNLCNLFFLLSLASARADEVINAVSSEQKSGSYQESYFDGETFVVKGVVEEGDLEFYGVAVKPVGKVIDQVNDDDDDIEGLEFIHNLFETSKQAKYIENFEEVLFHTMSTHDHNLDQRDLIINLPSVHCDCPSQPYYFNVEIRITPSSDARLGWCGTNKQKRLGNHINRMLLDLGVGNAGVGDNVVFLAKVCNVPQTFRRLLLEENREEPKEEEPELADTERELLRLNGFVYIGGGPCRGCPGDNYDRRKLATATSSFTGSCSGSSCTTNVQSTTCVGSDCTGINIFCSASGPNNCGCNLTFYDFLQDLNNRIKQYMKSNVVPNNLYCCGRMPGISVTTTAVSENNVKFGC